MTGPEGRRIVVGSLALTAGLAAGRDIVSGTFPPSPRILVGAIAAGVILTALSEPAPKLAAALAVTTLIAGVIAAGSTTLDKLARPLEDQ